TAIYQGSFVSSKWSGELSAYKLNGSTITQPAVWTASTILDAKSNSDMANRKILTAQSFGTVSGTFLTTAGSEFKWSDLTLAQKQSLKLTNTEGTLVSDSVAQDRLAYLRGDRSQERAS